jgi:deoxyribonuclease-4
MQSSREGPLLGTHVSAAGGLYKAVKNAERLGAEVIQMFGSSPQQWSVKLPSSTEVQKYRKFLKKSKVQSVYLHAAYLVNLATADNDLYKKSIGSLSAHLKIAELIEARGLVFHLGSNNSLDKSMALNRIVAGMKLVLKNVPGKSMLLMENSSGGGGKVGSTPEEMGVLLKKNHSERVGVCLDTAHAFEAGEVHYKPKDIKSFLKRWETNAGLDNLIVIHSNDSKTAFGSGVDRHENIGRGYIGLEGFKSLAKEAKLWNKDWILEVPGLEGSGPDKENLDILKNCFR